MRRIFILLIVAVFLTVDIPPARSEATCSGFGSIPGISSDVAIKPGTYKGINIMLFNCKEEDLNVEIIVENLPPGWWVDVESPARIGPDIIRLDSQKPTKTPSGGGNWFILSDGSSYIKTTPVKIKIGTPEKVWGGLYKLKVSLFASPAGPANANGFSIIPKFGREMVFDIKVAAPYKPQGSENNIEEGTASLVAGNSHDSGIIEDVKDKVDNKKVGNEDNSNDFIKDKQEANAISGEDKSKEDGTAGTSGGGLTGGITLGGVRASSLIILSIIVIVIILLVFYLRQ